MTDRSHSTPQLEAVRSIVAELDQARKAGRDTAAINARLSAAYREWSAAEPKVITLRSPQRTARNHRPTPKATPLTAKEAAERTRQLEAKAKARASSSPARSSNVEAINAERIEAILAAVERMATPDPDAIAKALSKERPAVRRAVTKHLQRKQAA